MFKIIIYILPIVAMIALIPVIKNDLILSGIYILFILITLVIKREKRDGVFLVAGFVGLFLSESFFISTGVETFNRQSLLGIMPLWLPILWSYSFLIMRRCLGVLESM